MKDSRGHELISVWELTWLTLNFCFHFLNDAWQFCTERNVKTRLSSWAQWALVHFKLFWCMDFKILTFWHRFFSIFHQDDSQDGRILFSLWTLIEKCALCFCWQLFQWELQEWSYVGDVLSNCLGIFIRTKVISSV